jgi:hypothetical protein
MNKQTKTIIVVLSLLILAGSASAYVPIELRTSTVITEDDVARLALAEHDAGRDTPWVTHTLLEESVHLTNAGRTSNDYADLRQALGKR